MYKSNYNRQYIDLISIDESIEYLKSFDDIESMYDLHLWLACRYLYSYPYRKFELQITYLWRNRISPNEFMHLYDRVNSQPLILGRKPY